MQSFCLSSFFCSAPSGWQVPQSHCSDCHFATYHCGGEDITHASHEELKQWTRVSTFLTVLLEILSFDCSCMLPAFYTSRVSSQGHLWMFTLSLNKDQFCATPQSFLVRKDALRFGVPDIMMVYGLDRLSLWLTESRISFHNWHQSLRGKGGMIKGLVFDWKTGVVQVNFRQTSTVAVNSLEIVFQGSLLAKFNWQLIWSAVPWFDKEQGTTLQFSNFEKRKIKPERIPILQVYLPDPRYCMYWKREGDVGVLATVGFLMWLGKNEGMWNQSSLKDRIITVDDI